MIGHKTSLNKFKKVEIISSTLSDHNESKLGINLKEKNSNTCRLNNMLNNEWVHNEIKGKNTYLEINEN